MTPPVPILFHQAMLDHRPEGWHPEHPEWLSDEQRALLEKMAREGARWGHPERPERLSAILALLETRPVDHTELVWSDPVELAALLRVHEAEYVAAIEALRGRDAWLHPDTTAVSPGSVEAAHRAAGAAIELTTMLMEGRAQRGIALVRPPGHHAGRGGQPRGFCLYNNIAIAAAHARARLGCQRVLVIDWDAHHGNGTQQIFEPDPAVLIFDTHLDPERFYPGTGRLDEIGLGDGEGATVNVPLPERSGDTAVLAAFRRILCPLADRFAPELVLVSAGFDAHAADVYMAMSEQGFGALCGVARDLADRHAAGRLGLVLEGGYNADALAASVRACLDVLSGAPAPEPAPDGDDPGLPAVDEAADFHLNRSAAAK